METDSCECQVSTKLMYMGNCTNKHSNRIKKILTLIVCTRHSTVCVEPAFLRASDHAKYILKFRASFSEPMKLNIMEQFVNNDVWEIYLIFIFI